MKKAKPMYSSVFKDIKEREVNLRSCEFLFHSFLKGYPLMKLNESEDWKEWKKRILTFFGELGKFYEYQI